MVHNIHGSKASFNIKPCIISRLVGRDFDNCRSTETLEVHDVNKKGEPIVHEIQRKEFDDYGWFQILFLFYNSEGYLKILPGIKFQKIFK